MEKWFIKNKKANFSLIASQFNISEVSARLIVNRGITSNEELTSYLNPSLSNLHNALLLKEVSIAVDILMKKIEEGKKIRIVGDYDVDGIISTYILTKALKQCGANVDYEIPDRIKDGYGINISILEAAHEEQVDTIITCDNGIAAEDQIAYAKSLGMTVIVTDHHDIPYIIENDEKKYTIPLADAVINPKQHDCEYPFKGICGAVVVYKLVEVLYDRAFVQNGEAEKFLEFAAIATVCDVMDLVDENRIIVKKGLELIHQTSNLGLKALIQENQLEEKQISTYHLGFIIGPCLNASGRLESAKVGLRLLLSSTKEEASMLASEVKKLNTDRKDMTNEGFLKAVDLIEESRIKEDKVIVVYLSDCHESIAGIIAGRIKERYHKPTIVLTKANAGVKGSARSIEEYNMFEGLSNCKDLLTKFGGHPMAAGLSIEEKDIEKLRQALNLETILTKDDLVRKVSFDMVLPFEQVDIPLIHEFSKLEPFGKGNSKPSFVIKNVKIVKGMKLGKNQNVLKLFIRDNENSRKQHCAMLFSDVNSFEECIINEYGITQLNYIYEGLDNKVCLDMVYYPDINEYQGYTNIQFIIQSYRINKE